VKRETEKEGDLLRVALVAEALSFVEEKGDDLKRYGLDPPKASVPFSGDQKTEQILYGDPVDEKGAYAMIKGRAHIVTVSARLLESLPGAQAHLKVEKEGKS
jgi:hypothetical protein